MKWTENGICFEGTVAEYKELHADGYAPQLTRTRAGKRVTIIDGENSVAFSSIKDRAVHLGLRARSADRRRRYRQTGRVQGRGSRVIVR